MRRRCTGDGRPIVNPRVPGQVRAMEPLSAINGRLGIDASPYALSPQSLPLGEVQLGASKRLESLESRRLGEARAWA
eukprot:8486210-Pyramimonas_sp.AAC.1